jgi:hypothetical protein
MKIHRSYQKEKSMIKKLFLASLLVCSTVKPDATDDLFVAIENCDATEVEAALARGADVLKTRTSDNHSPLSLAYTKQDNATKSLRSYKGILPAVAHLATYIASFLHNPKISALGLAGAFGASYIEPDTSTKTALKASLGLAGFVSLFVNAWRSQYKILAGIGTAGMVISTYQMINLSRQKQIWTLVESAAVHRLQELQTTLEQEAENTDKQ